MSEKTTSFANSVFEQPWWLDIVAPGKWNEAVVREGDSVAARLPYVMYGRHIGMPPLTQTLGPWFSPAYRQVAPGNHQLKIQKELLQELFAQLPKHRSIRLRLDSANDYVLPYRWMGYRYVPSFSYRISDLSDLGSISAGYSKTVKKNIRRAQKICTVDHTPDAERLIHAMEQTFQHQGRSLPMSQDLVRRIVSTATAEGHGRMFSAVDDQGRVHACSFLLYDEQSAYALLGGADPEFRSNGTKSLIWGEEITFAAEHSAFFDFEGSNIEGIENFVRQFGGQRVINYEIIGQSFFSDCRDMLKPRVKRLIGYKL